MYIDGDVLELDIEMDLEEVKSLQTFVQDRLDYIEEIVLLRGKDGVPTTSALFTLLFWVKRQKRRQSLLNNCTKKVWLLL